MHQNVRSKTKRRAKGVGAPGVGSQPTWRLAGARPQSERWRSLPRRPGLPPGPSPHVCFCRVKAWPGQACRASTLAAHLAGPNPRYRGLHSYFQSRRQCQTTALEIDRRPNAGFPPKRPSYCGRIQPNRPNSGDTARRSTLHTAQHATLGTRDTATRCCR